MKFLEFRLGVGLIFLSVCLLMCSLQVNLLADPNEDLQVIKKGAAIRFGSQFIETSFRR